MVTFNLQKELQNLINASVLEVVKLSGVSGLENLLSSGERVEVIATESAFKQAGNLVVSTLKKLGVSCALYLTPNGEPFPYKSHGKFGAKVIALGDSDYLNSILLSPEAKSAPIILLPTSPNLENLNLNATAVVIDEGIISKSNGEEFSKAFLSVMAKPLALIDYKMSSYLKGKNPTSETFNAVKKAVAIASKVTSYSNYKTAILGAEIILLSVCASCKVLSSSGEFSIYNALKLFSTGFSESDLRFTSLEKTAKLYHLFFSNDFSDLLSYPDYQEDIKILCEKTGEDANIYIERIKAPSKKRAELIYLLLAKTRGDFLKETGAILKALAGIKKIYLAIKKESEVASLYYKNLKNAVMVAPYMQKTENTLTLLRETGVLKCIN